MKEVPADQGGEKPPNGRRAYGRGLFDGLRMAGVSNPEEFMNQQKIERAEQGLNSVSRKIYDAVPIQDAWTKQQIADELKRTGTSGADMTTIGGCLDAMRGKGLISEPERGLFRRPQPKLKVVSIAPDVDDDAAVSFASLAHNEPQMTKPAASTSPTDPLTRLAEIAKTARTLSQSMSKLATDIEEAALDSEGQLQKSQGESEKLRQLQALLRGIGMGT